MARSKNILSLFDGIGCARVAIDRAGIKYDRYYASEIDKNAIKVTMANHPDTIQLGDVVKVKGSGLPPIYLLIGGSPCQGFSVAGKRLKFEDPRSKLFFEFVRLKNELKPKYFLLENVRMPEDCMSVISDMLNINPILINSSLVSAQSRERLYWTNIAAKKDIFNNDICGITQPLDRGIILSDILERNNTVDGAYNHRVVRQNSSKKTIRAGEIDNCNYRSRRRVFSTTGKSPALMTYKGEKMLPKIAVSKTDYRHLTPVECERLQTLPDNYTALIPTTRRYSLLGNSFTAEVITHILNHIKDENNGAINP